MGNHTRWRLLQGSNTEHLQGVFKGKKKCWHISELPEGLGEDGPQICTNHSQDQQRWCSGHWDTFYWLHKTAKENGPEGTSVSGTTGQERRLKEGGKIVLEELDHQHDFVVDKNQYALSTSAKSHPTL